MVECSGVVTEFLDIVHFFYIFYKSRPFHASGRGRPHAAIDRFDRRMKDP